MHQRPIPSMDVGPSRQDVVQQLERILSHPLFSGSFVISNFLRFIVAETLEGRSGLLKQYTIGAFGLGKGAAFDPERNAIVRTHAVRLRQLLAAYYNDTGWRDRITIALTPGSYVPVFRLRSRPNDAPMETEAPFQRQRHTPGATAPITLAVLPFRNLSPYRSNHQVVDSLVEGVSSELMRVFGSSPGFAVVDHRPPLTALRQGARDTDRESNALYLISGTMTQGESRFRISVALTETERRTQVWSNVFEYENGMDLFQAQSLVVQCVYAMLGGPSGWIAGHSARAQRQHNFCAEAGGGKPVAVAKFGT